MTCWLLPKREKWVTRSLPASPRNSGRSEMLTWFLSSERGDAERDESNSGSCLEMDGLKLERACCLLCQLAWNLVVSILALLSHLGQLDLSKAFGQTTEYLN